MYRLNIYVCMYVSMCYYKFYMSCSMYLNVYVFYINLYLYIQMIINMLIMYNKKIKITNTINNYKEIKKIQIFIIDNV